MSTVPHEEWIAEVQSKPLFSTVGDVMTTGMFKKVTTYGVSSGKTEACSDNTVRRRYSDFEWLYNLLCIRYQALVVPNIPPKGGMTGGGEAFMQRRVEGLSRFLKRCSVSPFIKADPSFQHFLTSDGTSGQWDTLKKTASSQCHQNFLTRPVIDQYRAHGMELATGDGAGDEANDDKIIAAYTRLAKTGAPTLSKVDASINMLGKVGGASDQATTDLTTKINAISEITTGADGDSSIISALGDFQSIVSVVNGAFEGFTTHQTFGYGVASVHLLPATHEVGACFSEVTVTMNRLKTLRKALTSSEKAKANAASALAKLEASGKPDKNNRAHDLVTTSTSLVESLTQEVKVSVRILCGFELNRVLVHCCQTLAKAVVKFADEMEANEKKLSQAWIMAANGLDAGGDIASTWKSVMTRLNLHGAKLEGSWVSAFDVSQLDNSSNI